MYSELAEPSRASDVPPSYSQIFNSPQTPSVPSVPPAPPAPPAPVTPMRLPPQRPEQPERQPFAQPQPMYVQGSQVPPLGPRSCLVTCHSCHQERMSKIRYTPTSKSHLFALCLSVIGLCCCACIPYLIHNCNNCNHYCSNCDAYLGRYK